jgi:hypothetical protein
MSIEICLKRGTAAYLNQQNFVLAAGEPCLETDTARVKYGDGATPWRDLPYTGATSVSDYPFAGTTVNTTTTDLLTDEPLTLSVDEIVHFDAVVSARKQAKYIPTGTWRIRGSAYRSTDGAVSILGSNTVTTNGNTAGASVTVVISGLDLVVRASSTTNKTIDWVGQITISRFAVPPFEYTITGGCTDPDSSNYDPLADFDDGNCSYPNGGIPDTVMIVPVTAESTITTLNVAVGSYSMYPPFNTSIKDYYVLTDASYNGGVTYSVTINDGAAITGSSAANRTLQITDGTDYYYVRLLPSDLPVPSVESGPEPSYVPGYYLTYDGYQTGDTYFIIYDQWGVPLWYTRTEGSVLSLHKGGDFNRIITNDGIGKPRTVGRINSASFTASTVEVISTDLNDGDTGWNDHEALELAAPPSRKLNIVSLTYSNGFYIQEQTPDGAVVWEWHSKLYFDAADPETFHVNSLDVHPVTGDILVSARAVSAIFCISYATKEVLWAIDVSGSLQSLSIAGANTDTKWLTTITDEIEGYNGTNQQHDARWAPSVEPLVAGNVVISAFDNQSGGGVCRGVVYEVNPDGNTVKHRSSIFSPNEVASPYMGNYALVADGDVTGEYSHAIHFDQEPTSYIAEFRGTIDGPKTPVLTLYMPDQDTLYRMIKIKPDHFRLDNLRATCGVNLDGTFPTTPEPPPPPSATTGGVELLLHFDGTNNSTQFIDSSVRRRIPSSNVDTVISTAQSKAGGSSAYFNGTTAYLEYSIVPFYSDDFTIEFWFRRAGYGYGAVHTIIEAGDLQGGGYAGLNFYVNDYGAFSWNDGASGSPINDVGNVPLNQWVHIALVRSSGTNTLYLDGVNVGTSTQTFNPYNNVMRIGSAPNYGFYTHCYIDDFRITKGRARYTADFNTNLPLAPFANPLEPAPSLLLHFDAAGSSITDYSSYHHTMTAYNGAVAATAQSKFGGASAKFDKTLGSYIAAPSNTSAFALGTEDFTVDAWIYPLSYGTDEFGTFFDTRTGGGASGIVLWTNTSDGKFVCYAKGGASLAVTASSAVPLNQWTHVAAVRDNDTLKIFVNGVQQSDTADLTGYDISGPNCLMGTASDSVGGVRKFDGYVDELRLVKGVAIYKSDFLPPTSAYANPAAPTLLAHFDTDFNVSSQISVTHNEYYLPAISSTKSKFGGASANFSGAYNLTYSGAGVVDFGTGDFTIEGWLYYVASNNNQYIFDLGSNSGVFQILNAYGYTGLIFTNADTQYVCATPSLPTPNTWHHFAVVRAGGVLSIYVDGMLGASGADTSSYSSTSFCLGSYGGGGYNWQGYLDEIRVTKAALYTDDFTPPSAAF